MRLRILSSLLLIIHFGSQAQQITVADLQKMIDLPSLDAVKQSVEAKGFKFYRQKETHIEGVSTTTWSYKYNAAKQEAVAWFSVSCDGNDPIRIFYELFDISLIVDMNAGIFANKWTFEDIKETDEEFTNRYVKPGYYLFSYQNKKSAKGTQYQCVQKLSKADPLNGISTQYHSNGNVKHTYEVRNGKYHGESRTYDEQGNLLFQGHWKEDKEEGIFSFYNKNGELNFIETYRNGILEGDNIFYYPNGKPKEKYSYSYGKKSGKAFAYDSEGNVVKEWNYIGDKKFGKYIEYTNGVESFKGYYMDDTLSGMFTETVFDAKGNAYGTISGAYKNNYLEGRILAFYIGTKDTLSIRHFKNNIPTGSWRFYNANKQLEKSIHFREDQSATAIYYTDGSPSIYEYFSLTESGKWSIRLTITYAGLKLDIPFVLPSEELLPNTHVFSAFEARTQLFNLPAYIQAPYKHGSYLFQNSDIKLEGTYTNDLRTGTWIKTFFKNNVSCHITYDNQNRVVSENFISKKGKPYTGNIAFEADGIRYNITVKKGFRNGPSIEQNIESGKITETFYENGSLKTP